MGRAIGDFVSPNVNVDVNFTHVCSKLISMTSPSQLWVGVDRREATVNRLKGWDEKLIVRDKGDFVLGFLSSELLLCVSIFKITQMWEVFDGVIQTRGKWVSHPRKNGST